MVLFSYSRIYRDQRLSARITRGIFVASYKGKVNKWRELFLPRFCDPTRAVARTLIGVCIFIYSGSARLASFEIKLISKEVSRA